MPYPSPGRPQELPWSPLLDHGGAKHPPPLGAPYLSPGWPQGRHHLLVSSRGRPSIHHCWGCLACLLDSSKGRHRLLFLSRGCPSIHRHWGTLPVSWSAPRAALSPRLIQRVPQPPPLLEPLWPPPGQSLPHYSTFSILVQGWSIQDRSIGFSSSSSSSSFPKGNFMVTAYMRASTAFGDAPWQAGSRDLHT